MTVKYYIDESGNEGEIKEDNTQSIFCLACIGNYNEKIFIKDILELKEKFRINSNEIKCKNIYLNKPQFIFEVINIICNKNIPFFIELVDKKYLLCANIVECHVLHNFSVKGHDTNTRMIKKVFADFLYRHCSSLYFNFFLETAINPDPVKVFASMQKLKTEMLNIKESHKYYAEKIIEAIDGTIDDMQSMKELGCSDYYKHFIPQGDYLKNGSYHRILPNLTSFTSIYARLNQYNHAELDEIEIHHDEQLQFDHILEHYKNIMDQGVNVDKEINFQGYNYQINRPSKLLFRSSNDNLNIQIADLVSGFCMRYARDVRDNKQNINSYIKKAFDKLIVTSQFKLKDGVGINIVSDSILWDTLCNPDIKFSHLLAF